MQQNATLDLFSSNRSSNTIFRFQNCSYSVTLRGKERLLLDNVCGSVHSGRVLAIMGPSGAGKTCLIDLLTLESREGRSVGKVTINGEVITRKTFSIYCATVPQIDRHWPFLTCRETIEFAADLLLPLPTHMKKERVNALLTTMGLNVCADTKVGNAFFPGLSGGQKRRLSIALALLANPLVLFLDEPTSGLDAAAAASIMTFIKKLAVSANICVVCTIHQPSSSVFQGFDKVMLLSGGRVAYNGSAEDAEAYFKMCGYELPKNISVAEFMLDLVNREFTDPKKVDDILDKYVYNDEDAANITSPLLPNRPSRTTFISQVITLVRRHGMLYIRDPTIYTGRLIVFFATCVFFSIVYYKSKDRTQSQIVPRMWLIQWLLCVPCMFGVVAVYGYSEEASSIKREVKNGIVIPSAYLVANFFLQVPLMFLLGISALLLAGYGIGNWQISQFGVMLTVWAFSLWTYECCAQFLSIVTTQPLLGMLLFLVVWFSSFLFNGILIDVDDVPWPFKLLTYIFPYKYSLRSMTAIEFLGTRFDGAMETSLSPLGFVCDNVVQCYGATGRQVLTTLGTVFRSISPDVDILQDLGFLFAIGCVMKIVFILLFIKKTSSVKKVMLPLSEANSRQVAPSEAIVLENF
jgi:ABC-type multidrug transport system ATPase subunit